MTQFEKNECQKILKEYGDFIPLNYAKRVQKILKERGIERKTNRIHTTRRGITYDLTIAKILQELAEPIKEKFEKDEQDMLVQDFDQKK